MINRNLIGIAIVLLVTGCGSREVKSDVAATANAGAEIAAQGNALYKIECPVKITVNGREEVHMAKFEIYSGRVLAGNVEAEVDNCFKLTNEAGFVQGEERLGVAGSLLNGARGIVKAFLGG